MTHPSAVSIDAAGNMYVVDSGDARVEKWTHANPAVHDTKTVYYSVGANAQFPSCGNHAEWANLPCQTLPAAQPEVGGMPKLPVTEDNTYNLWDEPEQGTETVGTTTRTTTTTYDAAGRPKTTATSSTSGGALPTITDGYTAETGAEVGALASQSITVEGKTKKITSSYTTRGQLAAYTDSDGNTSTYEYDLDGRPQKVNDGRGTQSYTYDPTLGLLSELTDSSAAGMKFTLGYDVEGNPVTEGYPNGMTATYAYNSIGTPTGLEYRKTTHCIEENEKCRWFVDTVVPSIHGQWLEQASTLSSQTYAYDADGRLTQVQSTPAGKGCTTRLYHYDEDTNITSATTREPGTEGKCATEGGATETHSYDEADRLLGAGATYSTFGDITALPAVDAGGAELTSAFYVDNQLQSQTQSGTTTTYSLDPERRTRETISTGTKAAAFVSHYSGAGDSPAWTMSSGGEATRYISGPDGQLAAVQKGSAAPELELTNLHGDVTATASTSEIATALTSKTDSTEYGVPTTTTPAPYSWLGGQERRTEQASGAIAMGLRSYIPQLGRFLQSDPIPGGSANAYSYTSGDPVNTADPSGAYTMMISDEDRAFVSELASLAAAARAAEMRAAEEAAARAAAEQAAAQAAREAETERIMSEGAGPIYAGGGGGSGRSGIFARLTDPVSGPVHISECNRSGQNCSGCRSGGKRDKRGNCGKGPDTGNGGVQKALVKCLLGGGAGALVDKTTPVGAAIGCAISFIPTP